MRLFAKISLSLALFLVATTNIRAANWQLFSKKDSLVAGLNAQLYKSDKSCQKQISLLNSSWNSLDRNLISKIKKWQNQENFPFYSDSSTLYYPFGGPDFLFAQTNFPKAKRYILVGLENTGSLKNIKLNSAANFSNYLLKLRHSLRYVNKAGYFVTKQMIKDLEQNNLNGVIHLFVLYLTKLKFNIKTIEYLQLNSKGKLIPTSIINPNIVRLTFTDNQAKKRELIYFKQNLSNYGIQHKPQFHKYLQAQKPFHCYMKSASYILFNKKFTYEQDFIIKNSRDILQDDSGISYKILKKNFFVLLYGNYSQTTKTFKWALQQDLLSDINTKSIGKLNYKIGYNRWLGETVLLYATHNKEFYTKKTGEKPYLQFGVQIAALSVQKNKNKYEILGYKPEIIEENGMYKYIIGFFDDYKDCNKIKISINEQKYPQAFIVIYKDGERLSPQEWQKYKKKYFN